MGGFPVPGTAWWVVAPGGELRHATRQLPGSWVEGEPLSVLCERPVKAPFAALWGRVPRSATVHERCRNCAEALGETPSREWDA